MSEVQNENQAQNMEKYFFRASAEDFKKIPGSPIAYWVSINLIKAFENGVRLGKISIPRQGLATMDNSRFTRMWYEISIQNSSLFSEIKINTKWYPYNKGGDFRKWYGNQEILVNWENNGQEIKSLAIERYGSASKRVVNEDSYFLSSITWSKISSSRPSFRYQPQGSIFDVAGMSIFPESEETFHELLTLLNSKLVLRVLELLSPTLNFEAGQIGSIPVIYPSLSVDSIYRDLLSIGKTDWNSYETSWDFTCLPLIQMTRKQSPQAGHSPLATSHSLSAAYAALRAHWREMTLEMRRLEEENNRVFIEAYGLQDELTPEVPLKEITLTCNPHYRYGGDKSEDELEALLLADTMRELVSYAVGCMFGRYSLDKPGLILANQGETIEDYYKKLQEPQIDTNKLESKNQENISVDSCSLVVQPSFLADEDNVIPMLDDAWFANDITERFKQFLKVAFGSDHYEENLRFMEESLNIKGRRNYSIRDYFLGEFYTDHVKRYKKRPIYWLFSSPKGSFNALIYMHRYRPDTASVVLNDYLREFRAKLSSRKSHLEAVSISASASQSEKTSALKEIEKITKMIAELEEYEREVMYPLATEQVKIDLDDGVKVNYPKFGAALKKIPGLDAKEE